MVDYDYEWHTRDNQWQIMIVNDTPQIINDRAVIINDKPGIINDTQKITNATIGIINDRPGLINGIREQPITVHGKSITWLIAD